MDGSHTFFLPDHKDLTVLKMACFSQESDSKILNKCKVFHKSQRNNNEELCHK